MRVWRRSNGYTKRRLRKEDTTAERADRKMKEEYYVDERAYLVVLGCFRQEEVLNSIEKENAGEGGAGCFEDVGSVAPPEGRDSLMLDDV